MWTPFAQLQLGKVAARGRKSFRVDVSNARQPGQLGGIDDVESARFRNRWQAELDAGDPYYNPHFSHEDANFTIDVGTPR